MKQGPTTTTTTWRGTAEVGNMGTFKYEYIETITRTPEGEELHRSEARIGSTHRIRDKLWSKRGPNAMQKAIDLAIKQEEKTRGC